MYIKDCLLVIRIISDNFVEDTIDLTNLDEEEYVENTVSDNEQEAEAGYDVKVNAVGTNVDGKLEYNVSSEHAYSPNSI